MAKKKSPLLTYAVYLFARLAVCFFQGISHEMAKTITAMLGWLAFKVDRRHRLVALHNLRHAFPERYSEKELQALVLASYRHFFTLMMEIAMLPRKMHPGNSRHYFDMGPRETELLPLLQSDRPLLIVTGHFGNWELAGYGLGARGFRTYAIARPLDNPHVEKLLQRFRQHSGQTMLSKKDLPLIQDTLAKGGKVAVLIDQNAGSNGLMVNFFGRLASTHKGVASLAVLNRARILVVGMRKFAEPMRYEAIVGDVIDPDEYKGRRAESVRLITQRMTSALERIIRTAPEQYFWLHNRWKQHPGAVTSRAA